MTLDNKIFVLKISLGLLNYFTCEKLEVFFNAAPTTNPDDFIVVLPFDVLVWNENQVQLCFSHSAALLRVLECTKSTFNLVFSFP